MNKITQTCFTFLIIILALFTVLGVFGYFIESKSGGSVIFFFSAISLIVVTFIAYRLRVKDLPGGGKGAKIQGIWILEKHLKFDPTLKKYEALPVDENKNYFEFNGNQFRSGDMDEDLNQLPAEYSLFSIEGDNLIIESDFFKKSNWKWVISKDGQLELTGETVHPKGKSQFIFRFFKHTK